MTNSIQSQNKAISAHLLSGSAITPLQALNLYGCLRLSARIYNLKQFGMRINSTRITTESGKHVSRYAIKN